MWHNIREGSARRTRLRFPEPPERKGYAMPRRLLSMLGAALLLTAAACGSSSGADGELSAGTEGETSTTAAPDPGEEPATLDSFFGFDPNDPDASQEQFRRWEMRQQELIATCMANQGFEYVPAATPSSIIGVAFDEEQFAREQGFGISTRYDAIDENDPSGQWTDPNEAIVAAMSESERNAYYEGLYGAETGLEAGAEESDATFWGGGCQGGAAQEVFGQAEAIFSELEPLLTDLQERVDADPRMADADQGWTACMSDRGYQYESADDIWNTALDDLQQRYQAIAGGSDPFAGWSDEEIQEFVANSSPQELDDFYAQFEQQSRQDVDQEALTALQEEEIALAVANYECGEARRQLEQEVRSEYEKEFIQQNRDALLRARDSLGVG